MTCLIVRLLLAFAVAGLAPLAHSHALTHLTGAEHGPSHPDEHDEGPSPGHPCETCLAHSAADLGPLPPSLPDLERGAAGWAYLYRPGRQVPSEALARFASRAPPLPSL